MAKLFTLKKKSKPPACDANRCKDGGEHELPGQLWGRKTVKLCEKHGTAAVEFAEQNPDYKPPKMEMPAAATGSEEAIAVEMTTPVDDAIGTEYFGVGTEGVLEFIRTLPSDTQDQLDDINTMLGAVKARRNWLEGKEKSITSPINVALQRVRSFFKAPKQLWASAEVLLKGKIKAANILQAKKNEAALAEAAEAASNNDAAAVVEATSKITTVGDLEGVTVMTKWDYVIEDESLIPREFMTPNHTLLKEHGAHSTDRKPTDIPGVKYVPDATVRATATKPEAEA